MPTKLNVNDHRSRIASVGELRQELAPFASQQFREIWVSMEWDGIPVRVVGIRVVGNALMQTLEHDAVTPRRTHL